MATKKEAGAGRGFVNPPTVAEMANPADYITPKQRMQMEEEVADRKASAAADKAYNKAMGMKKGGYVKGGSVSSASKRADGCAMKGKTKGTMIRMG